MSKRYSILQSSSISLYLLTPPSHPPPRTIYGIIFKVLNEKSCSQQNKTVVQCVNCEPKIVKLKGYGNSTSNYVMHLKRRHGLNAVEEYKTYLRPKKKIKTAVKQSVTKIIQGNFETKMIIFYYIQ